jgi:lipoprotein NlpI
MLATANKELRDYFRTRKGESDDWPVQVGHFLLDEISQDAFLNAADSTDAKKSSGQHCEAYFYIAIKFLRAGNVASAKLFFQQCIDTNVKTFYEYRMARIKLKQLEDKNFTQ